MATLELGAEVAGTGYVLDVNADDVDGIVVTIGPDEEGASPLKVYADPHNEAMAALAERASLTGIHIRYVATAGDGDDIYLDQLVEAADLGPAPAELGPPPPLEGAAAELCPRCLHPYGRLPLIIDRAAGVRVHRDCPAGPNPIEAAAAASPEAAALAAELEAMRPTPPAEPAQPAEPPAPRPRPAIAPTGRRGPRVEEGKPWQPYNSDGSINLGSYAYTAAVGTVELATRIILERNRELAAQAGTAVEAPSRNVVTFLARTLLEAADRVQAAIRPDGMADRMDNSHTRARGAIRDALDLYPVPFGVTDDERAAWVDAVVDHATMLLEVALAVVEPRR